VGVDAERAIAQFWSTLADDVDLVAAEDQLIAACDGLPAPRVLFERASLRDFLGLEADAVPLYEQAVEAGLERPDRERAIIQLASSLRNLGRAPEAEALLRTLLDDEDAAPQATAFLALTLADQGRDREALRAALQALAPLLPEYGRAVAAYARELPTE
jgi:tetratricopeptide (TPR) repeat protein